MLSTYIATRCHALIQKLISEEHLLRMAHAENVKELTGILLQTSYGNKIKEPNKTTAEELYEIYKDTFMERADLLQKRAGEGLAKFIENYLRKIVIEDLIKIMRKKVTERTIGTRELTKPSFSTLPYSKLRKAENIHEVFTLLNNTPYAVKGEILPSFEKYGSLLPVEGYLWKKFYENVMNSIKKLPDSNREIKELIGKEIDIKNYFIAVGPALYGYSPELAETLLIQPTFKVSMSHLRRLIHSKRPKEFSEKLPYGKILRLLLEQKDTKAEIEASREMKKWLKRKKMPQPISSLYVMLYLKLAEFEFRNLHTLTYGKKYRLSPETILENLI